MSILDRKPIFDEVLNPKYEWYDNAPYNPNNDQRWHLGSEDDIRMELWAKSILDKAKKFVIGEPPLTEPDVVPVVYFDKENEVLVYIDEDNNRTTYWLWWAVDSVNWQTGVVVLNQDNIGDWTTYKQYSSTEKTKLAWIEAWAQVNTVTPTNTVDLTNKTLTAPKFADNWFIADANGNELLSFNSNTSAVNYLELENGATGNPPHLRSRWDDTNIWLHLVAKWTWEVSVCDATDETKRLRFGISNNGTGIITTLRSNSTWTSKTIDLPNESGTIALTSDLTDKLDKNTSITWATKTKITYDADWLVTSWADATTADIADSSNKRYVTDTQLTVIWNTSWTNTGDETLTTIQAKLLTATTKSSLVNADQFWIFDSAASSVFKRLTWSTLKTEIKSWYDSITSTLTNKTINLWSNTLITTAAQFQTAMTDNDVALINGGNIFSGTQTINWVLNTYNWSQTVRTGIANEVSSDIINFWWNEDSSNRFWWSYNSTKQWWMFRVDTRVWESLFSFLGRPAWSTSLVTSLMQLWADWSLTVNWQNRTSWWTSWTPTVYWDSWSWATLSWVTARYKQLWKTVFIEFRAVISSKWTASWVVYISKPIVSTSSWPWLAWWVYPISSSTSRAFPTNRNNEFVFTQSSQWSNLVRTTVAINDEIVMSGTYETN